MERWQNLLAAIIRLPWLEALLWVLAATAWYVYSSDSREGLSGPNAAVIVGLILAAAIVRAARSLGRTPPPPPPPTL